MRALLGLIANRPAGSSSEFSAREIGEFATSVGLDSPGSMHQVLSALCERGLIYRTRHGYYAFTIPYSETMIVRRLRQSESVFDSWNRDPAKETMLDTEIDVLQPVAPAREAPRERRRGWFRRR